MTTAIAGRVGRRRRHRRARRTLVAGFVVLLALSAVIVHLTMPAWYARWWYPMEHGPAITAEAAATGVAPDLIAAVIFRESKYTEDARSARGAVGLMQVLPETAQWIHTQHAAPAAEPERLAEPAVNIAYGTWYLKYLTGKYGSEDLALAAYNGGETNLQKWIATAQREGHALTIAEVPFSETRSFVGAVHDARSVYRRAWPRALGLR
jgi:soluble lytic murein transglycosylase